MPNIAYRDIDDPELSELVETIRARRSTGKLLNLDRMLLHSPPFARGWNAMASKRCMPSWRGGIPYQPTA